MSNKEVKDKVVKEEKGKNKLLCKTVKFTLVVTLKFKHGNSEKLKTHFNSNPDVSGCNLPDSKDFTKAYKKLMKKYRESLPKDSLSKAISPKIVSRNTKIYSTVGQDNGCSSGGCECKEGNAYNCGVTCSNKSCRSSCAYKGTLFDKKCICCFKFG